MKIIDMGQLAKESDTYFFDTEKLSRVTPEIKKIVEDNFPKQFYGEDILVYEAWGMRHIIEVAMLVALERLGK